MLDDLARQSRLIEFLESQTFEGRPLIDHLGGWLGASLGLRQQKIVSYHKNWIYLTDLLGLQVVEYVESKPGIPPSARHVHNLVEEIGSSEIEVLLAANYFSRQKVELIAERTGISVIRVPMGPGGEGIDDYFQLVDLWIESLRQAFAE